MTDLEIYQLAGHVISSIAEDLQSSIYSDLGGNLSIAWSEEKKINAWAESTGNINEAPSHTIGFHYELVRQIYRDIEYYCEYLESKADQQTFDVWFKDEIQPFELLTSHFSKEAYLSNMFMGAITWIFFHELGHLQQEHGYIRNNFIGTPISSIHECNIYTSEKTEGKSAAIFHVTEMAADFEATHSCILELIRQFQGEDLKAAIYGFVSGISCVLYRFHGSEPFVPEYYPQGSHPNPLIRLESIVPHIYEFFSMQGVNQVIKIELTREYMVQTCTKAASAVGLFWLRKNAKEIKVEDNYFWMGSFNRPGMAHYMKIIIEIWDEIKPTIKEIRRFGTDLGLLTFTQEHREKLKT